MKIKKSNKSFKKTVMSHYSTVRSDPYIFYSALCSVLFSAVGFVLIFLYIDSFPSRVPVYYSLPWGPERLAESAYLLILPASVLIIFLINGILSVTMHKQQVLLSRLLLTGSAIISFLSLYTLIRIIILIT